MARRRAVFLDRDGVLNAAIYRPAEGIWDSPYILEEFRLLSRAAEAMRLIKDMGFLAVVVSNQPGIAKGKCTHDFLAALDAKLREELAKDGATLDAIYYCLHHPDGMVDCLRKNCGCRKPEPGLVYQAGREHDIDLSRSYLIGDRPVDIEAGRRAGCKTILVGHSAPLPTGPSEAPLPDWVSTDLWNAAQLIWREEVLRGDFLGLR